MVTSLLTSSTSNAEKDFDNILRRGEGIMGKSQQRDENSHSAYLYMSRVVELFRSSFAEKIFVIFLFNSIVTPDFIRN